MTETQETYSWSVTDQKWVPDSNATKLAGDLMPSLPGPVSVDDQGRRWITIATV